MISFQMLHAQSLELVVKNWIKKINVFFKDFSLEASLVRAKCAILVARFLDFEEELAVWIRKKNIGINNTWEKCRPDFMKIKEYENNVQFTAEKNTVPASDPFHLGCCVQQLEKVHRQEASKTWRNRYLFKKKNTQASSFDPKELLMAWSLQI